MLPVDDGVLKDEDAPATLWLSFEVPHMLQWSRTPLDALSTDEQLADYDTRTIVMMTEDTLNQLFTVATIVEN